APHKSKRCAFGCSRSGRASAKQLVASVFTWPAAGLFRIFSKPPATPLRLSRRFDNTFSESQAELSRKTVGEVKTTGNAHRYNGRPRTTVLFPYQRAFCATILASDELTRLGIYGGGILRGAPTPRIDKLASEGTRLLNFNVEAQCSPSRSALMTGRFPIRSGTYKVPLGGGPDGVTLREITIPELLSARGYA